MARRPEPRWYESRKAWYVELGGKQYLLAKGKGGKAEAFEAFHRLMAEGASPATRPDPSVQVLVELFLGWSLSRVGPVTLEGYVRKLQSFIDMYGDSKAADIRPFHVTRWLDSHRWNDSTKFGYVTAVKRAFNWARKQGHLESNPVADMDRPPMGRRTKLLTREQYEKIMGHVDVPRMRCFRDLLEGLWETGCRPSELVTLTADRVDLDARRWTVLNKTRHRTGDPTRPVMLTDAAVGLSLRLVGAHPEGIVFRNHRGRAWTRHAMACNFARIRGDLGYGAEVTAYAFRHRYGTDALLAGQEVATVATVLGHKSTTMIMRHYSHLSEEHEHLMKAALAIRPAATPSAGQTGSGTAPVTNPAPEADPPPAPRKNRRKPSDPRA